MAYRNDPFIRRDPEQLWEVAVSLLADFTTKHIEIGKVRDLVRQRVEPKKVLDGRYLITARSAMAWAIVAQIRSFFERATRKVEVMPDASTRAEDARTSKNERWLIGSSEMVNRRASFVESQAIYNGIETGEMSLGAVFDPYLAKRGEFPIEVLAPDPQCVAYSRSHYGLTYFVLQETRTVDAIRDELTELSRRGKSVFISDKLLEEKPRTQVEDTRLYTPTTETRWVDGEYVHTRRHFCGRIPFDIAYFYDMPSEKPEEWGRGVISPVRDLLESYQQLIDMFTTDAELGQRPLGILFDGMKGYQIVQINPGEEYPIGNPQATSFTPVPYNPNHQLLHELAAIINEQVDVAALPRSTFSGPQLQLSGYALDLYTQGVRARMEDLKKYPELALSSHYALRLQLVKRFATNEMAKRFSPDDTESYFNSFSVVGTGENKKGTPKRRTWWTLTAEDVTDNPIVYASLTPNLPADESAKMQRMQVALSSGFPWEWAARNVYDAENVDELLAQRELELLLSGDEMFKQFYFDVMKDRLFERDPKLGKSFMAWLEEQNLLEQAEQPMDGNQIQVPPELSFLPEQQPEPEGQLAIPPELLEQMMAQGYGQMQPEMAQMSPDTVNQPLPMMPMVA